MKIVKLIHKNSRSEVFKMNRMNYITQTFVWGGAFKYSIILNTKKIYKCNKLTNISTF